MVKESFMSYLRREIKGVRELGWKTWWYGRKGIIYCPSAIIGEGHSDGPEHKCVWCGMTREYDAWITENRNKKRK